MRINLKYLLIIMLFSFSIKANDTEHNDESSTSAILLMTPETHLTQPHLNQKNVASSVTFQNARHVWFYGTENDRNDIRPILHNFIKTSELGNHFGTSRAFLLARHLFNSVYSNNEDKQVAAYYLKSVWLDKNHSDHAILINLMKKDTDFNNAFCNILLST